MLSATETDDWCWFEDELAYDQRAPCRQAMIQTGLATRTQTRIPSKQVLRVAALADGGWQTAPVGLFSGPVGTESFGKGRAQVSQAIRTSSPSRRWAADFRLPSRRRGPMTGAEWAGGGPSRLRLVSWV